MAQKLTQTPLCPLRGHLSPEGRESKDIVTLIRPLRGHLLSQGENEGVVLQSNEMTNTQPTYRSSGRFDAIVSDIDGCLCDEHGGPFDLARLGLIREHNEHAIRSEISPVLTVCSGRPVGFAEAMTRLVGNTILPAIGEMGVYLHDPKTAQSELDPAVTAEHLKSVAGLQRYFHDTLRPMGVTMQPGKSASVTFWHSDTKLLRDRISPGVESLCQERGWPFRVSMSWYYINCDLTHISKATGIERFKLKTGIPADRLAGIGDTSSDLAIREKVAFFACPSNAIDEIKAVADYVAKAPEAEGVVEILGVIASM